MSRAVVADGASRARVGSMNGAGFHHQRRSIGSILLVRAEMRLAHELLGAGRRRIMACPAILLGCTADWPRIIAGHIHHKLAAAGEFCVDQASAAGCDMALDAGDARMHRRLISGELRIHHVAGLPAELR